MTKGTSMTNDPAERMPWEDEIQPDDDVVEAEIVEVVEVTPALLVDADALLDDLAAHDDRARLAGALTDTLLAAVRGRSDRRRTDRLLRLQGGRVESVSDLRRELVGVAADADVMRGIAAVFTAGAKEADQIAGDLLTELPPRTVKGVEKPPASAKVGDGEGFELKVSRAVPTESFADLGAIVDVLVSWSVHVAEVATKADPEAGPLALGKLPAVTYAAGLREGIEQLRSVLAASPPVKSTALDALVVALESADLEELAKRLRKLYGRRERASGEATVKIDRTPIKPKAEKS